MTPENPGDFLERKDKVCLCSVPSRTTGRGYGYKMNEYVSKRMNWPKLADETIYLIHARDRKKKKKPHNTTQARNHLPERRESSNFFPGKGFNLVWQWACRNMRCTEHPSFLPPPRGQREIISKSCLEKAAHLWSCTAILKLPGDSLSEGAFWK